MDDVRWGSILLAGILLTRTLRGLRAWWSPSLGPVGGRLLGGQSDAFDVSPQVSVHNTVVSGNDPAPSEHPMPTEGNETWMHLSAPSMNARGRTPTLQIALAATKVRLSAAGKQRRGRFCHE